MAITSEEIFDFVKDAERSRDNFMTWADASWEELKKRDKANKVFRKNSKRKRYPIWWSIFRIRQPLVLARAGVPIGKDTTLDGSDPIGATAALLLERLAINLEKADESSFDTYCAARDDFLATNLGWIRAYYERDVVKEKEKEYLTAQADEQGNSLWVDSKGNQILDGFLQDDQGVFVYTRKIVDVKEEKICLEHLNLKDVYVDPDVKRWNRVKRLAFKLYFSRPEFIEHFGEDAFNKLPQEESEDDPSRKKSQLIEVIEYWDCYERKVLWAVDKLDTLLTPTALSIPDTNEQEEQTDNGLYDLKSFFPVPKRPLLLGAPTDEFYPVPEYYHFVDIIDNINIQFRRMYEISNAIRATILFDSGIEGLEAALRELRDAEVIGVTGLANMLAQQGGSLENLVQYVNVKPLVESLGFLYENFDRSLQHLYQLSGTNDLLQGLASSDQNKTLGERQLEEKYALNVLEPFQRKMQEFVCDCHHLRTEIALKNFSSESLDRYINPGTLPEDHKQRYQAALQLLKDDSQRFRIELETDSTVAINEAYDKAMRAEITNIITQGLERVANIAQASPPLVALNLKVFKYLVQAHRGAKMFSGEITQSIDALIKQSEQAQQDAEPPFDRDKAEIEIRSQELQAKMQIEGATLQLEREKLVADVQQKQIDAASKERVEQYRLTQEQVSAASKERIEAMRLQQEAAITQIQAQIDQFKAEAQHSQTVAQLQMEYEKIQSAIATDMQTLALKRQEMMLEVQKMSGELGIDSFRAELEEQAQMFDAALKTQQHELETQRVMLDQRERYMTELRLQQEHELEKVRSRVESIATLKAATQQELPPITVQVAEPPKPKKSKRKFKIQRDDMGELQSVEEVHEEESKEDKD